MTASDVLDGAFAILKRSPGKILGFAAVFTVPVQMVSGWLQRDILGGEGLVDLFQDDSSLTTIDQTSGSETWAQIVLLFGPSLALVFVAAGLARLVGAWHVGHDLSFGELLSGSLKRAWPLLASWTLVHLAEGVGLLLCGLPALAAMTWFLVVAPVIGAEDLGPIEAMRRSARLTTRRFWPVLGLALLSALVATLFGYALGLLPTVLSLVVGTGGLGWIVLGAAGVLTGLITTPVVAAATVLIYLDLRVRTEGLDLELAAAEAIPQAAARP
ncbi:MAG: hypothetical protein ACSLFP_04485 [Acidimicrobiales bacterium]